MVSRAMVFLVFFFFFTETETVLAGDTPRHSSNTEGAVHSQEPSNVIL